MGEVLEFDGSNALRSKISAHVPAVDENGRYPYTEFVDLETDHARRILKRRGIGPAFGTIASAVRNIHEYEYVNPSTGVVTRYQIVASLTAIYIWNGAAFALQTLPYVPSGGVWSFDNFDNRCWADNGKDPEIYFDGTSWKLTGIDAPASSLLYSLGGAYTTGTVSGTNGLPTIVGTAPAIWTGFAGKQITINGVNYRIGVVTVNGNGVIAPQLTLDGENFKETTAAGLSYTIHTGVMDWDEPPFYTVAYKNPTTGHYSDAGPVLQITEKNQVGVTPTITLPGSAGNTTAFNAGFTEIAFFRSNNEGAQMRLINTTVANNNAGTDITLVENATTGKDTGLLNEAAPIAETNKKPPVGMLSIASAMGRRFGLSLGAATDTARLYFCALNEELKVGRGSESWPRRFSRHGVNRPTGVLAVGGDGQASGIVILALDGIYTIDGYDNATFTPPYRMPGRRSGTFPYGVVDVKGDLAILYQDKRLYQGGTDIGAFIQDKLNDITAGAITASRLHWFAYEEDDILLVMYPRLGGISPSRMLIVDYDNERLNEWRISGTAFGTCHEVTTSAQELWFGNGDGSVHLLLQDIWTDGGSNYAPYFRTAKIRRAERSICNRIEIFVGPAASTPASLTWNLTYRLDEDTVGRTVAMKAVVGDRQSAQGLQLVYEFEKPEVFNTIEFLLTFPSTDTALYVEKMLAFINTEQETLVNS